MIEATKQKISLWISAVLALTTILVFSQVVTFDFTTYDDPDFITANPIVKAGLTAKGFEWVWHSEVARNWHPVTMLSHMLDCQLFGAQPWWPHLVNVLLHAANAALLFLLLKRMTGTIWRSAMVAALFALHPLHVESVAWVAERKDVLSTLFWFLATLAYLRYTENPRAKFYILTLVLFAVGLMCKPMLVTVPFALLLLDYWPLGRMKNVPLWRLALEKVPFVLLSAAVCVITYSIQQHGGSVQTTNNLPMNFRVGNAFVSYVRYIGKMFWPHNLAALYLRSGNWTGLEVGLAVLFLVVLSAIAIWQYRNRPWLTVGWFWYVGTLVPVIGIVQAGMQTMADRYTYVPLIGLFIIVAWGGWELLNALKISTKAPALAVAALAICAALTWNQLKYWKNSETLYTRMINATPNNFMAHYNLGNFYSRAGNTNAALTNYEAALAEEPNYADAHNNIGAIYLDSQHYGEAIQHYRAAVRIEPDYLDYFNLANALADAASFHHDSAQFAEAVATYHQALQINPSSSEAHHNLGLTFQAESSNAQAIAEFAEAARLDPKLIDSLSGIAISCAMQNQMPNAESAFRKLVQLRPNDPRNYGNFGNVLASENRIDEAIPIYLTALKLNPNDYQTEFNLGLTYARDGKKAEAESRYREALRIKPDYQEAKRALEQLQIPK